MIDIGQILRKAYVSALSGQITIEGNEISIVDEKLDTQINENDTYIMVMDQIEDMQSNQVKDHFSNECLLRLQIVTQSRATNTRELIESVATQILTILFPSKAVCTLQLDAPLMLSYAKYTLGVYNPVAQDSQGFNISKLMTFKNRVTQ